MKKLIDVAVLGLGPSGTVAAHRAAQRGLNVVGFDPKGVNAPSTVGLWAHQIPPWLPAAAVSTRFIPSVITQAGKRELASEYAVLAPGWEQMLSNFEQVRESARPVSTLAMFSGNRKKAWLEPDPDEGVSVMLEDSEAPENISHLLISVPPATINARQLAHGFVVPESALPRREPMLMDFSPVEGFSGDPVTFSYRIPLGDGTWLIEETILATTIPPEQVLPRLEARCLSRMQQLGISTDTVVRSEVVNFPLGPHHVPNDRPRTRLDMRLSTIPLGKERMLDIRKLVGPWGRSGIKGEAHIGGAGGWMHPATGYSVGTVLAETDTMLDRVLSGKPPTSRGWRANYSLRRLGLHTLLSLSPARTQLFFEVIFSLEEQHLQDYLTGNSALSTAAVMVRILVRTLKKSPGTALAVLRAVLSRSAF